MYPKPNLYKLSYLPKTMVLTPDEIEELKEQLRQQVQNLPEQQRQAAEAQIESLSADALESMLEQQRSRAPAAGQKSIFRMIIDNEVQSYRLEENKEALAVLDINPITKGHTLVIPKSPVAEIKDIPAGAHQLASEISKTLAKAVDAKKIDTIPEKKFGEAYLHLIPITDKPLTLNAPRTQGNQKELAMFAESFKLAKKPEPEKIKITKTETNQVYRLARRIP